MTQDSKKKHENKFTSKIGKISNNIINDYRIIIEKQNYSWEKRYRRLKRKKEDITMPPTTHNPFVYASIVVIAALTMLFNFLDSIKEKDTLPKKKKKTQTYQHKVNNLLYITSFLYSAKDREAALGDLEESYNRNCSRFDKKRALKLLKVDICYSIYPIAKNTVIKLFTKTLKVVGILKIYKIFWG